MEREDSVGKKNRVEEKKEVCNMIEKMKYKLSLVLSSIASSHFSLLCIRKLPQP